MQGNEAQGEKQRGTDGDGQQGRPALVAAARRRGVVAEEQEKRAESGGKRQGVLHRFRSGGGGPPVGQSGRQKQEQAAQGNGDENRLHGRSSSLAGKMEQDDSGEQDETETEVGKPADKDLVKGIAGRHQQAGGQQHRQTDPSSSQDRRGPSPQATEEQGGRVIAVTALQPGLPDDNHRQAGDKGRPGEQGQKGEAAFPHAVTEADQDLRGKHPAECESNGNCRGPTHLSSGKCFIFSRIHRRGVQ